MGRILIVDDEPHMRRILASNLHLDKHEITEAAGLEEARAAPLGSLPAASSRSPSELSSRGPSLGCQWALRNVS